MSRIPSIIDTIFIRMYKCLVVFIFRNDCFDYLSRTNNKQKKSARIKFYLCEYDTGYFLTKKKPTQASLVGFSMCSEL